MMLKHARNAMSAVVYDILPIDTEGRYKSGIYSWNKA